ncbi:MAG: penicillin acylase family protein [Polyangiaceae bacterium]|nr:penicillin acylase family protein [Polyangiaceae bacterium]
MPIDNLEGPVDVVRDKDGRVHIYASSIEDAARAEGYMVAQDRHLQIEFFRRVAEGRLAEILADADPSVIDTDISFRHIGLHRTAKQQYALLTPEEKSLVDAYADGVSQYFRALRDREVALPAGILVIQADAFTDFTGEDALAIARLQTYLLSYDGDGDISWTLTLEALKNQFAANSPDPKVAARSGMAQDVFRFAPWDPATTTTGYPMGQSSAKPMEKAPDVKNLGARTERYRSAVQWLKDLITPEGFGSNNWAVGAARSSTGHALVASDPHLSLSAPAVFWPVSMEVKSPDASKQWKLSGISFPGIPGIILGHNEHLAWGATVAGYDVTDVYAETLTPDGKGVIFKGQTVALEMIDEVIHIQGGGSYTYQVPVVPHHGPIFPEITPDHKVAPLDPAKGALSVKWTGTEPTSELSGILGLLRAKNVDEAREELKQFKVGGQNWMIGDTNGDILWTSHVNIPKRDAGALGWNPATMTGTLPCLVLPGDGSAEWNGYLPSDLVPWEKNPTNGFIATANNDNIGDSLDNDPSNDTLPDGSPMYLGCSWDLGFREGRIQERLKKIDKVTPEDMASIQGDVRSPMGANLAPVLIAAINRAEAERMTPGTHPELSAVVMDAAYDGAAVVGVKDLLTTWAMESDYEAASGVDPTTNKPLPEAGDTAVEARAAHATLVFNTFLARLATRVLGDEFTHAGRSVDSQMRAKAILSLCLTDPTKLETYDAATQQSILWDDMNTPEQETKDEQLIRALLDAIATLTKHVGTDTNEYRWGAFHTIRFEAIIPLFGQLAIPPVGNTVFPTGFPRHGDNFAVDACNFSGSGGPDVMPRFSYGSGPTQRFVVDMDPAGPKAWNALPGGAVWDSQNPHFSDSAELWRRNETHPVPFLLPDVIAAAENRVVFTKR